jgi:hypothetical protein
MMMIIKYNTDNTELVENNSYEFKFDANCFYGKIELYGKWNGSDHDTVLIEQLHGRNITMKYCGLSRIDGLCLFIIDIKSINRNNKIEDILKK